MRLPRGAVSGPKVATYGYCTLPPCCDSRDGSCDELFHVGKTCVLRRVQHHGYYGMCGTYFKDNGKVPSRELRIARFPHDSARYRGKHFVGIHRGHGLAGFRPNLHGVARRLFEGCGCGLRGVSEEDGDIVRGAVCPRLSVPLIEAVGVEEYHVAEAQILCNIIHTPQGGGTRRRKRILLAKAVFRRFREDGG